MKQSDFSCYTWLVSKWYWHEACASMCPWATLTAQGAVLPGNGSSAECSWPQSMRKRHKGRKEIEGYLTRGGNVQNGDLWLWMVKQRQGWWRSPPSDSWQQLTVTEFFVHEPPQPGHVLLSKTEQLSQRQALTVLQGATMSRMTGGTGWVTGGDF